MRFLKKDANPKRFYKFEPKETKKFTVLLVYQTGFEIYRHKKNLPL